MLNSGAVPSNVRHVVVHPAEEVEGRPEEHTHQLLNIISSEMSAADVLLGERIQNLWQGLQRYKSLLDYGEELNRENIEKIQVMEGELLKQASKLPSPSNKDRNNQPNPGRNVDEVPNDNATGTTTPTHNVWQGDFELVPKRDEEPECQDKEGFIAPQSRLNGPLQTSRRTCTVGGHHLRGTAVIGGPLRKGPVQTHEECQESMKKDAMASSKSNKEDFYPVYMPSSKSRRACGRVESSNHKISFVRFDADGYEPNRAWRYSWIFKIIAACLTFSYESRRNYVKHLEGDKVLER